MNDRTGEHPLPERLAAFGRHALREHECAAIDAHVTACDTCRQFLETLPEDPLLSLVRDAAPAATPGAQPLRLHAGYEILEEIGRGGMGIVYRARQIGLNRTVALKRLHAGRPTRPEALARFRREAEAAARLDHPNIVQIYEVGEQDGLPYLALEYVDGDTLDRRLGGTPLPPRQAAALVETLARAMAVAHRQGIVHRDLKPANILLKEEGGRKKDESETERSSFLLPKITDFGLARLLDQEGVQTQTGEIMGTPAYMAPEQTRGQPRDVGPAVDIYALGAILYEALTGRPPFQAAGVLDTLEQVRTQEPVPPSRLQPQVPRDLDTICLKCLHKEPPKRFAGALDLADDLRRFREGEAIRARPVPRWERAGKWARRRPAAAGLLALSGLAVAALVGGLWLHTTSLSTQVKRAEASEAKARKQQARADTNYRQAREAINQLLARLDKFHASGVPQIQVLRRELRKGALAFFQEIARAEEDADPATRRDVAHAYLLIAGLEEPAAARVSLEQARLLLERLIAEEPANGDHRAELGRCFTLLGNTTGMLGSREECLRFRERALAVYQELCRDQPDNADWQRGLALCHTNLGCHYEVAKRWPEAEFHWQQAVRTLEELTRRHPGQDSYQYGLAINYTNLALLYGNTNRVAESFGLYRKAEALLTPLVRAHPEERAWGFALAQTLRVWGACLNGARRGEEARPHLARAVQLTEELLREDPLNPWIKGFLLGCLVAHMNNCTLRHSPADGESDWQRGFELSTQLNSWSDLYTGALWDARFGAHALAATRAERLAKQPGIGTEALYELVKAYTTGAEVARKDGRLPPTAREHQAERYAAAAVALLARLGREGYFKAPGGLERLNGDDDLEPLRRRADYKDLLATVGGMERDRPAAPGSRSKAQGDRASGK